jgi:hypothetical protein
MMSKIEMMVNELNAIDWYQFKNGIVFEVRNTDGSIKELFYSKRLKFRGFL